MCNPFATSPFSSGQPFKSSGSMNTGQTNPPSGFSPNTFWNAIPPAWTHGAIAAPPCGSTQPKAGSVPTAFGAPQTAATFRSQQFPGGNHKGTRKPGKAAQQKGNTAVSAASSGKVGASAGSTAPDVYTPQPPMNPFSAVTYPSVTGFSSAFLSTVTPRPRYQQMEEKDGYSSVPLIHITAMWAYNAQSIEELRFDDYRNNKAARGVTQPQTMGWFPPQTYTGKPPEGLHSANTSIAATQQRWVTETAPVPAAPVQSLPVPASPVATTGLFSQPTPVFGPTALVGTAGLFNQPTYPFGLPSHPQPTTTSLFAPYPTQALAGGLAANRQPSGQGLFSQSSSVPFTVKFGDQKLLGANTAVSGGGNCVKEGKPVPVEAPAGTTLMVAVETQTDVSGKPRMVDTATNTDSEVCSAVPPTAPSALHLTLIPLSDPSFRLSISIPVHSSVHDLKQQVRNVTHTAPSDDIELVHDGTSLRNRTLLSDLELVDGTEVLYIVEPRTSPASKLVAPISMLPKCDDPCTACTPSLLDLGRLSLSELGQVRDFSYWSDHGRVTFVEAVDVTVLSLTELVKFEKNCVTVYPGCKGGKQPVNPLSKAAKIVLKHCEVKQSMSVEEYVRRCKKICQLHGATFRSYTQATEELEFLVRL